VAASQQSSVGSNDSTEVTARRALELARAKWGKNATVREDPAALDRAGRARASAALHAHRSAKPSHPDEAHRPDVAVRAAWLQWREAEKALQAKALRQRCHIGRLIWNGSVNLIVGQGDTWAEACANAGLLPLAEKKAPQ
jgi:hypothetical protein